MDQSPAADARRLAHKKQDLILAVRADDRDTIVSLLDEGIPINTRNNEGESLLHGAAQDGHVTTMRLLIRKGCKVDLVDARGLTPLHSAAAQGQTKAVRELIRNQGASKSEVASIFGTPLHQAASKGHVETVVAMLEEGCPLDVVNSVGSTVLHWAAEGGHVELVRELVGRGCDVNAVRADGCTPLHCAAAHGRTEVVRELIKLGATKSIVATMFGTPIDQARLIGHEETVKVLLVDEVHHLELTKCDTSLKAVVSECNTIGTSASFGVTPVMSALLFGKVKMFKSLISKGGTIRDRDIYSLSTFEHCFVGGHASKLQQLCEACGIGSGGESLKGALATLINQGLVDARKVLCLCAISGDSVFLEDQFIELFSHDASAMPAALKCAKFYFFNGVEFLNQLNLQDEDALNPLQLSLLSFKCYEKGHATRSVELGAKDHTSFITSLLSHRVLKKTALENFPNGLSPLDIAQQFKLHHIAELIEGAGGRPGVWADIPQDVFLRYRSELLTMYPSLMKVCDTSQGGHEVVKKAVIRLLGGQTVESVVHVADDSQLMKEQVLDQRPNSGDIVKHVLPCIQVRHWKKVGLALDMEKDTVDGFGQQFSNEDDCYLATLSYWLEHGSSVTWKTLLDVLGYFETWHTVDELTDKIVSVLGGGHQVPLQLPSSSGSTGCIEQTRSKRTAQLSWSPTKWRRTSDAATPVQALRKHAEDFLDKMNCKEIVIQLRALELIPESVEYDILHSNSRGKANAHLLNHLKFEVNVETAKKLFRIASEEAGYEKMNAFAAFMLRELQ